MELDKLSLSSNLSHTWLIDLDGTVLRHNGHLSDQDELLPGVKNFWGQIPKNDFILLLTARSQEFEVRTMEFLRTSELRFNKIVFNLPKGERILINDIKPFGLATAISVNVLRDEGLENLKINLVKDF